jgi:hypothetical protein
MSIFKTRTEQVIDVQDWDQLVIETYGRPYSFQQQDGCKPRGRETLHVTLNPDHVDEYENETVPEIVNHDDMGVTFEAWLARDPKQRLDGKPDDEHHCGEWCLELWWDRNFYPTAESIAHDLCKRGLLPEGTYTIDIDW